MGASSSIEGSPDMNGPTAILIQDKINNNPIMIFSKSACPFCKIAKNVFNELGESYEVLELDKEQNGSEMQDILKVMTGARSVPRVFIGGKCIGGGTETKDLYKSGELQKLIEQVKKA